MYLPNYFDPVHRPREVQVEAKRLFKLIDLNSKGEIELEELAGVLGFVPPRVSSLGTRHSHRSGSFSGTPDSLESHVHHSALSAEPPEIHANVIDQAHRMLRQNPMLMVKKQGAQRCVDQWASPSLRLIPPCLPPSAPYFRTLCFA